MASFQDETLDQALARLKQTARGVIFARRMGALLPLVIFLAGGWVLVARFVFDAGRIDALWGLGLVACAPVLAWSAARRELPEEAALVAWLDKRAGGTGAILTQYELGDARWKRAAAVACHRNHATDGLPEPAFQTAFLGSLPAGLFVALALWFSPPEPPPAMPVGLFDRTLETLAERLEDFDAVELVDPDELAELTARLEDIAATLDEGGLESAFEALDRFQEDLAKLAEERTEELAALREAALSAGEGLSEELSRALSDPAMAALLKAAVEQLKSGDLAASFEGLEGLEGLSGLDPAALEALGGALSEELARQLAEMARAGMIDQRALERALARRANPRSLKDHEFGHAPDCASKKGGL